MQSHGPISSQQESTVEARVKLSNREHQILALIAEGDTDAEIGIQLGLTTGSVSWYVGAIRTRLSARSRAHAVALAIRQGILSEVPPAVRQS
jgi:NarL family two-component system response regulator LiaR